MTSLTLRCPACSRPLAPPLPALCPGCGSPTDRPPPPPPPEPDAVLLLQGTTDADDGQPYTVHGGPPIPRCPECDARLPAADAPTCDRCGWNRAAGRKLPKTYPVIDRSWEAGWSFRTRVIAFIVCQFINVATAALIYEVDGRAVASVGGFFVAVACQAFLIGTFDRLDLKRSARGKVTLTQQWRVAFYPLPPKTLQWRGCEELRVLHAEPSWAEYFMLLFLAPTVLPAIVWWWYVIRPGHVKTALCKTLGDPVMPLYLGSDRDRAEEIAKEVSAATGLPWRPHGG
jgi:hypothetical protein